MRARTAKHPNLAGSEHSPTFPTPGAEPPPVVQHFIFIVQRGEASQGWQEPGPWCFPELHPCKNTIICSSAFQAGQLHPGLSLLCSCSVCTSYSSTAKPRKGRKNLQKAEIETASLLLSVLSKKSERKGTKANTDYSNNLFNLLLLLGENPRKQPKNPKKAGGNLVFVL